MFQAKRAPTRNPNLDPDPPEPSRRRTGTGAEDELLGPRGAWWWTGLSPRAGVCPGMGPDGALRALPLLDLARCTRRQIADAFDNAWTLTEVLFSALQGDDAFYQPPHHGLRHPLIFYYGHSAVFYVNKLRLAGLVREPIDASLERLLEMGVDEMSWDDLSRNREDWPAVRAVHRYRGVAYAAIRALLDEHPAFADGARPILEDDPAWGFIMALEHDRVHLETSSVLFRELPLSLLRRPEAWPALHPSRDAGAPRSELLAVPAGDVTLGKPRPFPSFGWDNEYGERHDHVRAFRAGACLVTNAELLAFVESGGYREPRFWSAEGLSWRTYREARCPSFWVPDASAAPHRYLLRTCFELVPLPGAWPAEVNHFEAKAYCAWRTERDQPPQPYRLLTEAEHRRLRGPVDVDPAMVGLPEDGSSGHGLNLALAFGSPGPVTAFSSTEAGFHDVGGNVWQWCEDHLSPLPGFRPHSYYPDFSVPCFDGKHHVILGGSFASTGAYASAFARSYFRPHFFQHAGFRLACSDDGDPTCDAVLLGGSAARER